MSTNQDGYLGAPARVLIYRKSTSHCYLVKEGENLLWGNRDDAIRFASTAKAQKIVNMMAFPCWLVND